MIMLRHGADFTISGIVAGCEEIRGRLFLLVKVERGQNTSLFRFVLDDEQARFARSIRKGEQVLINGALWSRKKENGYFDITSSVNGLYIRAGHSRDDDAPAADRGGSRLRSGGASVSAPAELRRDKTPWQDGVASPQTESYTTEQEDIPF